MSSSDFQLRNKMLKKDQVYNWFDKYETSPHRDLYLLNRVTVESNTQAQSTKSYKLAHLKRKLTMVLRT